MHNLYKSSDWNVFHNLISSAGQIKHYEWGSTYRNWLNTYNVYRKELEDDYSKMLKLSNKALNAFGGDPSLTDWSNFRPLRLSREEDWADWLMHLIEQSGTGVLSSMLFNDSNREAASFIQPDKTYRELTDHSRRYRADMIIKWDDQSFTHIEVKIGDHHLKKTFPTSETFRTQLQATKDNWLNYILLLDEQLYDWECTLEVSDPEIRIEAITWTDVAVALRKSLVSSESMIWKSWAYTFLGAIEQCLLGIPATGKGKLSPQNIIKRSQIIKKAISDE